MDRDIFEKLRQWKNSKNRKPLLLQGARQIGKTWIMRQFGKREFEYVAEFNFDELKELKAVFARTKDPVRLIADISLYSDVPIQPGKTLIIFDEIQESEDALNSLKYFAEKAPEYAIIAAGSLLGVAVRKKNMTVPVGKVHIIKMFPLTFREFLREADNQTYQYIEDLQNIEHLPEIILSRITDQYRRYSICGGMWMLFSTTFCSCINWILQNMPRRWRLPELVQYGIRCRRNFQKKTESLYTALFAQEHEPANTKIVFFGSNRPGLYIKFTMFLLRKFR